MSPRAEILATGREMHRLGLVAGTQGNVSAREGERIHITPSGLAYEGMSDRDLVTLSPAGEVLAGAREPSSEYRVHLAVYAHRPDVAAIVHTHSVHATAWSSRGRPLEAGAGELEDEAGGPVPTAAWAPSGSEQIARAAVEALEDRRAVLLARHGVVGVGRTPAHALEVCTAVEHRAELALARSG